KALIDSDPCVGRPDCLVIRHIVTPSIIKCADAVWVLARLEHLELRQVLRYGFPRAVRHFAIALQALKSSRSGSGVDVTLQPARIEARLKTNRPIAHRLGSGVLQKLRQQIQQPLVGRRYAVEPCSYFSVVSPVFPDGE